MLQVVEEEDSAESEQNGVSKASAEERVASCRIHVSHGWWEVKEMWVLGRGCLSLVNGSFHIPAMAFSVRGRGSKEVGGKM